MKKIFTFTLLAATLFLSGCNSSSTQKNTKSNLARNVLEPTKYEIIKSDKYPASDEAYNLEGFQINSYHSDTKEDIINFKKEYKKLTAQEYDKDFEGTMIVAKVGFKSSSNYSIKVEDIEANGRYTNIHLVSIKSEGCITTQAISSPYIITLVPNHKEVKYTIKEEVIRCN